MALTVPAFCLSGPVPALLHFLALVQVEEAQAEHRDSTGLTEVAVQHCGDNWRIGTEYYHTRIDHTRMTEHKKLKTQFTKQ